MLRISLDERTEQLDKLSQFKGINESVEFLLDEVRVTDGGSKDSKSAEVEGIVTECKSDPLKISLDCGRQMRQRGGAIGGQENMTLFAIEDEAERRAVLLEEFEDEANIGKVGNSVGVIR